MAMKCASCGKGVMYGHNVSHAKNRTRKIFKPNLHSTRVVVEGVGSRKRLCTKCLRMYKKVQISVLEKAAATKLPKEQPATPAVVS